MSIFFDKIKSPESSEKIFLIHKIDFLVYKKSA